MTAPVLTLPQDCWLAVAQLVSHEDLRRMRAVSRSLHAVATYEDARRAPLTHMVAESTFEQCAPLYTRRLGSPGATIGGAAYASCSEVYLDKATQQPWFVALTTAPAHGMWQRFVLDVSRQHFEPRPLPRISQALQAALENWRPKSTHMVAVDHLWVIAQHSRAHWARLHILDIQQDRHFCTISLSPTTLRDAVPMDPDPNGGLINWTYLPELWDGRPKHSLLVANLVHAKTNPYLSLTLQQGGRQLDVALDYRQGRVLSVLPSSAWGSCCSSSGFHLLDAQLSYIPSVDVMHRRTPTWLRYRFDPSGARPRADIRQEGPDLDYRALVGQDGLYTLYVRGCAVSSSQVDARAIFAVRMHACGSARVLEAPIFQGGSTEAEQVFGLLGSYVTRAPSWLDRTQYSIASSLSIFRPLRQSALLRPYPLQQLSASYHLSSRNTYLSHEGDSRPRRVTYAQYLLTQNPSLAPYVVVRQELAAADSSHALVLLRLVSPKSPPL